MGGGLSSAQKEHARELQKIIRQRSCVVVSVAHIEDLLREIDRQCPWYPDCGSLWLLDWIRIGITLHSEARAPVQHLLLWQRCKEALEGVGPDGPKPVSLLPPGDGPLPSYPQLTLPAPPPAAAPPCPPVGQGGAVAAAVQPAREAGLLTDEESSCGFEAFPVSRRDNGNGGQIVDWEALPYSVLCELRKAVRETGVRSTFTLGILEGVSNGYFLLPQDWKDMCRMVLSPAQYVVWDNEYQREALAAAAQGRGAYLAEQLYGAGQFSGIPEQAVGTPRAAYPIIGQCVRRAFRRVPAAGESSKSFAVTRQGAAEPFHQFIDRLQEAVQRQIDNPEAQTELMQKLAYENANADCRHKGEASRHVINHMIRAMAIMGHPSHLKTDNGPAYCSSAFASFCTTWDVVHTFGIPYNPTGQAIVEWANRALKQALAHQKQKGGIPVGLPPRQEWLAAVLFTLNHLNLTDNYSAAERHFRSHQTLPRPLVKYRRSGLHPSVCD
uniref:Integrase catalytic domain-containing protein n=1 Tax=Terrapene triunguis TaxID=2587831 RepID=A0A674JBL7_9SAUR